MAFQVSAIDDEELVHNAVRHGHVISLEIYLNQNPNCINKIYTSDQSKWTPLLAACFYKHEHIVRLLLTRFKPDVNIIGTINFYTLENSFELSEEVSPLRTAAAVNHFDIVKLLIEHGKADVNQLIKTHSTPLRAACYHNNLEMVQYLIKHGANIHQARKGNYTNLMLASGRQYPKIVEYLIDKLHCDINEKDENGQTALYYAVRSGSTEITKILLEHGALNIADSKRKITPLMRAALFGEENLVNLFETYCSAIEWIEAKELLATSFSGCISSLEDLNKTDRYIREAFKLREETNLPKQFTIKPLEFFIDRYECKTLEEYNQLVNEGTKDVLHVEVILIHQRLLGDSQSDFHDVLHHYGTRLACSHQYHDCFRCWFYEFNLKQKYNLVFPTKYLQNFIYYFTEMKFTNQIDITIDDLLEMFKMMTIVLTSDNYKNNFDYNFIVLLHLITIVARIMYSENDIEKQNLSIQHRQALYKSTISLLRNQLKTEKNGASLLHLSVSSSTSSPSTFVNYPCWMTTKLLIECGADVNALDNDGVELKLDRLARDVVFTQSIDLPSISSNEDNNQLSVTINDGINGNHVGKQCIDIFTSIFIIFTNLSHLDFITSKNSCYAPLGLINLPCTTCHSSTIVDLNVTLFSFDDCLYLLDGRLSQLQTFIVKVEDISDTY